MSLSLQKPLSIAIAKGYLWDDAIAQFQEKGIELKENLAKSRKLETMDSTEQLRIFIVRPWDVPVYVETGAADLGIVGKDVLLEREPDVAELLDLGFGGCDLVIAAENGKDFDYTHNLRIASKYTQSTERFFRSKGLSIQSIKLYGAIELAPLTGMADAIADLTATGTTLKENNLRIIDRIFSSTARLIANPVSAVTRHDDIQRFTDCISA